jgi:hypothetical protein
VAPAYKLFPRRSLEATSARSDRRLRLSRSLLSASSSGSEGLNFNGDAGVVASDSENKIDRALRSPGLVGSIRLKHRWEVLRLADFARKPVIRRRSVSDVRETGGTRLLRRL